MRESPINLFSDRSRSESPYPFEHQKQIVRRNMKLSETPLSTNDSFELRLKDFE